MVDTVPPKSARNNAQRGLELRKEWGRGGTSVGVARARDISNGASLSRSTIARMSAFNRHRDNYQPDKKETDGGPTAGTIAWLLWGGTTGIEWAQRKLKEIDGKKDFVDVEYKELSFSGLEVKQDGETNVIEGYASVFGNEDHVGDVVERGAFIKSIAERMPKMLWQHKMDKPIGVYTEIREDDRGLYVKGKLANTPLGNEVAELARMGAIDSMSIGYSIPQGGAEFDRQNDIRLLKQVDLFEISLVTFPANEQAKIISAKNDLPRTEREFEKFLRDAGYSRKQATAITLAGFKAESSQRDAGLEALHNTFNQLIERIKS